MKTEIIIVFDEQKEKSSGKFVVYRNGELTERLEFENIANGDISISHAAGVFSESLKDQFIKK